MQCSYLADYEHRWHTFAMDRCFFCPISGQVAVRRSVEFHLTDWFNE